ncbi:MAG: glycosyltransferase [Cyanobacteria bacterium P01_H01_bin.74]
MQNSTPYTVVVNAAVISSEGGVRLLTPLLAQLKKTIAKSLVNSPRQPCKIVLYLNPKLVSRLQSELDSSTQECLTFIPYRPPNMLIRFLWEQCVLPFSVKKHQANLLFSFANTGPIFPGCRQILYLQQSLPYTSFLPQRKRFRRRLFKWLYYWQIALTQLGSSRIVVPTPWLIDPLRRSVGYLKPEATYVASLPGPIPQFEKSTASSEVQAEPSDKKLLDQLQEYRNARVQLLLYPCFLAPYKNIPFLLDAIEHLARQSSIPFKLLLTFDQSTPEYFPCKTEIFSRYSQLSQEVQDRIVFMGTLAPQSMSAVYQLATLLVFPSLVETLGVPLLEALHHKLPVVALQSEKPNATEAAFAQAVCGDAAVYVPPEMPETLAETIAELLQNPSRLEQLGQLGAERMGMLHWDKHLRDCIAGS